VSPFKNLVAAVAIVAGDRSAAKVEAIAPAARRDARNKRGECRLVMRRILA
jgi:hypothetical protein